MWGRRLHFKASLFLSILAVIVLLILISLGRWQIGRAEQKQVILDLQSSRSQLAATPLSNLDFAANELRYLPVSLHGKVDAEQQILIDNQVRNGRAGYFVLTPIKLANNKAVLLNRGWLPIGANRANLPNVDISAKTISSLGRLDHFPTVGIQLQGADQLSDHWPAVTQLINLHNVAERLGYEVLPYQVLMDTDQQHGYLRQWMMMKMGPKKHYGYAFQWFALALAWLVIYFVVTIKQGVKRDEYINKEST